MFKLEVMLPKIKTEELTVHHHFAQYFKDKTLEPYLYVLSKRMGNGHICIPVDDSINDELIEGGYEINNQSIEENALVTFAKSYDESKQTDLKPFVFYKGKLYLQRYFVYENQVLEKIEAFSKNVDQKDRRQKLNAQKEFILRAISKEVDISSYTEIEKVDWQAIAAILGVLNNITFITGGPGTGKTTTVAKILSLLKRMEGEDIRIALTAPTGKASTRMKESLLNSVKEYKELEIDKLVEGSKPFTIHRLLGTNLNSPFFKHNKDNPLPYDVVIIDESSMIGLALFAKLITAIPSTSRIIILGDSEQLASVDAGTLFGDICLSQTENENRFSEEDTAFFNALVNPYRKSYLPVLESYNTLNANFVRLKKTYRFDNASALGAFTKAIIEGNKEQVAKLFETNDTSSLKIDAEYNESFLKNFALGYKEYIEENDITQALKKINKCRVLCAVKQGEQGVYAINDKIKSILKNEYKNQSDFFNPTSEFYHNQLIIVTKNQQDLNLFNGDVGLIRKGEDEKLKVYFQIVEEKDGVITESYRTISPGFIEVWDTVFAMTIHKSQGSEFNEVLVILPKNKENRLLTRELVYTGITRAKECAYIQTTIDVLLTAVEKGVDRVSGLEKRILKLS
jgi:exodeoxyribonuclease V alpha subunit